MAVVQRNRTRREGPTPVHRPIKRTDYAVITFEEGLVHFRPPSRWPGWLDLKLTRLWHLYRRNGDQQRDYTRRHWHPPHWPV